MLPSKTPRVSQPIPLERISSRDSDNKLKVESECTFGRFKKTRKSLSETAFSFTCGFFFGVMIPLNSINFDYLPLSTSLFLIKDAERIFNIREV